MISQSIVVLFVLLLTLIVNYYLTSYFGFNQETFTLITVICLTFGLALYLFFSKPLLEPLFKSDENLQKAVKETIHELNIPVSTIDLNVKMLEKTIDDEKSLKRLQRIKDASNNLLKLYNQMEYSIKKELDKVDTSDFELEKLITHSLEKFEDLKQNITIEVDVPEAVLKCDQNGFEKVIDNLISNAIKYNKEDGFIKISFKNNILSIENSGKSIDTKNLFMVFDKYYQESNNNDGFGLGLNIVKEYCDKNAIDIKIESKPHGTAFNLNLQSILV